MSHNLLKGIVWLNSWKRFLPYFILVAKGTFLTELLLKITNFFQTNVDVQL